jgi:hypothetical protein
LRPRSTPRCSSSPGSPLPTASCGAPPARRVLARRPAGAAAASSPRRRGWRHGSTASTSSTTAGARCRHDPRARSC